MVRLVSAAKKWELSEKSVVRSVKWLVGDDKALKEAADVMLKGLPWTAIVKDKPEEKAATSVPCWENNNSLRWSALTKAMRIRQSKNSMRKKAKCPWRTDC